MPGGAEDSQLYLGRIDPDAAVAYAMATNDPNQLYMDGVAAPPMFTVSLLLTAFLEAGLHDRPPVQGATKVVHGEHDTHILGPVVPGMELQWESSVHSVHNTKGGVIETRRILVADRAGRPLVEHLWSNFSVNGHVDAEIGPMKPDHTFPASAREHPVGARTVPVDRDQGFRYAGVSGDRVGHALDDEIARSEGYPGKILQGLCTFGICSGALVQLAAGGDPRRVRRLAGRFSKPTFPAQDLEIVLFDLGRLAGGVHAFAFEAHQGERTVMTHGRVEVADTADF